MSITKRKALFPLILLTIAALYISGCSPNPLSLTEIPSQVPVSPTKSVLSVETYYIDAQNGADSNPGSESQPWQTIQHAANVLPEGDIVVVHSGHYPERVTVRRPNLTFHTDGEVLMQGFSIEADYTAIAGFTIMSLVDEVPEGIGIDVPRAGFCLIEDNRFLYNTWGGLRLLGSTDNPSASHDCIVRNNLFFRNAMYGAEVMGQNHLIENNEVSHTIQFHPCSSSTASWLDADGFRFHGSGHIFRNNYIHDIPFGTAGYETASCDLESLSDLSLDFVSDPHTDCFQTYDGDRIAGHDILFEGNRCQLPSADKWQDAVGAKAFQGTGNTYNLTFRNNLVVADLLSIFADGCHDITIVNNTFIGSGDAHSQGLQFENCLGNIQVKNNVFYDQRNGIGHIWQNNSPVDAGYNCIYRTDGRTPARPADPGDLWNIDPLLDPAYRLSAGSPCIDAGINMGVDTDFDGTPRPQGEQVDIGAFEFHFP